MTLISFGYGRTLFEDRDPERARLLASARALGTVHHLVFARTRDGLQDEAVGEALFLYSTNARTRFGMFFGALHIGHRLLRTHPDAIVTGQDPLVSGLVAWILARLHRRPLVLQEHGDIFSENYWRRETLSHRLWYMIALFLIRRADRVRVVSKRVAAHVEAIGVVPERIRTLPVFSDLAAMQARAVQADLHAAYPHASPIVLSVARFVPQKNLYLLIRAFAKLHAAHPQALLVLVGRGPLEAELRQVVAELQLGNAIVFKPWAMDVASLMKTADIYALASNYEGWARVLPEAMACGLPVVTTDVGCADEVCIHERHGFVVPVGDENAFADALVTLATHPECARMSAAASADVLQSPGDFATYTQAWASVYSDPIVK